MTALDLEGVKARAGQPDDVLDRTGNQYSDEYIGSLIRSQADVLPLVALIEKIRDDAEKSADQYQATADRLWDEVTNLDPNRSVEDATRYSAYAANARATATIICKTIEEGPKP